jgi:hypothetical protein
VEEEYNDWLVDEDSFTKSKLERLNNQSMAQRYEQLEEDFLDCLFHVEQSDDLYQFLTRDKRQCLICQDALCTQKVTVLLSHNVGNISKSHDL